MKITITLLRVKKNKCQSFTIDELENKKTKNLRHMNHSKNINNQLTKQQQNIYNFVRNDLSKNLNITNNHIDNAFENITVGFSNNAVSNLVDELETINKTLSYNLQDKSIKHNDKKLNYKEQQLKDYLLETQWHIWKNNPSVSQTTINEFISINNKSKHKRCLTKYEQMLEKQLFNYQQHKWNNKKNIIV